jgi:hypothetical protein
LRGCNVGITDEREFLSTTLRWLRVPSFIKIGRGVQATLKFCLSNLRDCNVGIIDGFISAPFRWAQVP